MDTRAFVQDVTKQFLCHLHSAEDRLRLNYMQTSMYTHGYVVLPALVDITPKLRKKVTGRLRQAGTIFNANETQTGNDRRRLQVDIALCDQDIPGFERLYVCLGIPDDVSRTWTVLQSLPGCQAQGAHVDYEIDPDTWVSNDPRVSHGCLLALSDGTKLDVWRSAHLRIGVNTTGTTNPSPISRSTITLNAGDAVVFRADCLHAGSAYPEANVRLHCYLDRPKMPHATNRVQRWNKMMSAENLLEA
jgi:ectoine hydroxylase-related dioxygenase (phytanoyl-CoA dioxygenase family)